MRQMGERSRYFVERCDRGSKVRSTRMAECDRLTEERVIVSDKECDPCGICKAARG